MSLQVAPLEAGRVRVFALSLSEEDAQTLADAKSPDVLGLDSWDPAYVEIFALRDLDSLGLAGYLETGCGVDPDSLAPDRTKLAQLDGWVMLIFSKAFSGVEATLRPTADLTLIGSYVEPGVDWSSTMSLTSEAAQSTALSKNKKRPSDAAMSGRIAMIVLLVLFALTGLMVWIAA